jgi:squalene synthase HpnC
MTEALGRSPGEHVVDLPGDAAILPLAGEENFPVAMSLLGRRARAHLLAIYGFARLTDQIGDEYAGNRLALLDWLEQDLERAFSGRPEHPLLQRLAPTVRALDLPRKPFLRLIEANRVDQAKKSYETFADLLAYCDLSANPVGELVLCVFGQATIDRIELSDRICTALQLVEHWQDVAQDFGRGRVYIPAEDLERFGIERGELGAAHAGDALRRLLAFELERARALLDEGAPLVGRLRGRARLAVAGYVGGARAAAEAVVAARFVVLAGPPPVSGRRRAQKILHTYGAGR